MKCIMIAGTASGVGKTTVSLGLMAAFTKRNKKVMPFKVGPDYIDPSFHKFVTGNPSHNLDSWLLSENCIKYLFQKNMSGMDLGIIEGVMGLFDGYGTKKDEGSSAHVSKILNTPVILVMNCKGMSSSAAAMALGYKLYDSKVPIKGVILNKVSGKAHYDILKQVIERDADLKCLGYLPNDIDVSLSSRHLGLIPANEVENLKIKVDKLSKIIEKYIDLDEIEKIAAQTEHIKKVLSPVKKYKSSNRDIKIGIAKDSAFTFYYEDNLRLIEEMGVQLIEFSPLRDKDIPKNVSGLYFGGGFPEVFAKQLEENKIFRNNLKKHLENSMPAYAECGGLMYLTKGIESLDGNYAKMVGFFPTKAKMTKRLQRFGYVNVSLKNGLNIKAHEFHRSKIEENDTLTFAYDVKKIKDGVITKRWRCGLRKANTLAGYPHIHFYSNPEFLKMLIDRS